MKLKDIFPKWILREKSYGELELGGSFAHLTESEGDEAFPAPYVHSDARVFVGDLLGARATLAPTGQIQSTDGTGAANLFSDGHIDLYRPLADLTDPAIAVWDYDSGNAPWLEIHGDGSLHWGDGTNAPDLRARRLANESGAYLEVSPQGGADGVGVQLFGYGGVYVSDGPSWAGLDTGGTLVLHSPTGNEAGLTPNAANHLQMAGTTALAVLAHGGGVAVTSPDGTKSKLIGIDNAGALVLTDL